MLVQQCVFCSALNPAVFEELWANSQHRWKLKKLIFTGMLPLSVLYRTLQKQCKTLQFLKSYEQTPNTAKNWKKIDIHGNATSICALSNPAVILQNPAVFEELWADSQHRWKLKSWYSRECYLHLCSIKPCKTLQVLKSYEQTPNIAENWKSWYSRKCYLYLSSFKPCQNSTKPCSVW